VITLDVYKKFMKMIACFIDYSNFDICDVSHLERIK